MTPPKMKGKPKVCPRCLGEKMVAVKRQSPHLEGFLGAVKLPCPRCKMQGWIEETEIDCEANRGNW